MGWEPRKKYLFEELFPKPRIPQKRYLIMFIILLYVISKVYVSYTPTFSDDNVPDQVVTVIQTLADNEQPNGYDISDDIA